MGGASWDLLTTKAAALALMVLACGCWLFGAFAAAALGPVGFGIVAMVGAVCLATGVGLLFRRRTLIALAAFGLIYLGAYGVLSRLGYAEARADDVPGFYYLTPENTHRWQAINYGFVLLFRPVNVLDQFAGGMGPASEPFWLDARAD